MRDQIIHTPRHRLANRPNPALEKPLPPRHLPRAMFRTTQLANIPRSAFLALLLTVPTLRAADPTPVAASRQSAANSATNPPPPATALPAEQLSYHTDARWGRTLFIRNDDAQPTPAEVARRPVATPAPSGALFNRDDLARPEWTNAVATARDFLRRHARDFLDVSAPRQSAANPGTNSLRRSTEPPLRSAAAPANAFDPDTDLMPVRAERDALGMTHVRFAQTFHGLPVFGADASVHLAPPSIALVDSLPNCSVL